MAFKGQRSGGNLCPYTGGHPTCWQEASKNSIRSHTQESHAISFLFSISSKFPVAEMRPCLEGSDEDASSCRAVPRGGCTLPTSQGLGLPYSWLVVTSGSLRAWSRCAVERWTGIHLWGRISPSSCWCQLTPRPPCLCRTDTL